MLGYQLNGWTIITFNYLLKLATFLDDDDADDIQQKLAQYFDDEHSSGSDFETEMKTKPGGKKPETSSESEDEQPRQERYDSKICLSSDISVALDRAWGRIDIAAVRFSCKSFPICKKSMEQFGSHMHIAYCISDIMCEVKIKPLGVII